MVSFYYYYYYFPFSIPGLSSQLFDLVVPVFSEIKTVSTHLTYLSATAKKAFGNPLAIKCFRNLAEYRDRLVTTLIPWCLDYIRKVVARVLTL